MMIATGIVCIVFGLIVVIGQLISVIDFGLAQRLGLQEKDDETDPLHRRLELNTARWDLAVFWTLPAAGGLMLAHHAWWPFVALVAGAVCVDTAGRETAKVVGLSRQGVKTGSVSETRLFFCFLGIMLLIGVWCVGFGFAALI
jgi:hypothetical protein